MGEEDAHAFNARVLEANASYRGIRSASFGAAAGIAVLFYASGIPRIQRDILQVRLELSSREDEQLTRRQPIPFLGKFFIKEEIPASDNVSDADIIIVLRAAANDLQPF